MHQGHPNSFSIAQRIEDCEGLSVLAVTLDDLCRWEGLERLDYLKIDAEGAEGEVLSGAKETITRFRPVVQCETIKSDFAFEFQNYCSFQAPQSPKRIV